MTATLGAVNPQPTTPTPNRSFWARPAGIVTILGAVAVAFAVLVTVVIVTGHPKAADHFDVQVTSCRFEDGILPTATVSFTVTNKTDSVRSVWVDIVYRDSAGARVDTDSAYLTDIAPSDTVRRDESTFLDAAVSGGSCAAGVR